MGKILRTHTGDAPQPAAPGRFITTDTRIDGPHSAPSPNLAAESEPNPAEAALPDESKVGDAPATIEPEAAAKPKSDDQVDLASIEWLRNEARQLAVQLAARQDDIDRRDAQWQSDVARFENESRMARLRADSMRRDVEERETAATARERELDALAERLRDAQTAADRLHAEVESALAAREEALKARETEIEQRGVALAVDIAAHRRDAAALETRRVEWQGEIERRREEWQAELDRRREEFLLERAAAAAENETAAARRAELERLASLPSAYQEKLQKLLDEREADVERREQAVAEQELRLREALSEWERLTGELVEQRDRNEMQARHDRLQTAEHRRASEEELAEKRAELERQAEQIDFRRAALRREQETLTETQREVLEQRLAAEELWTRLSGHVAPAALAEHQARLRSKLTEQYRLSQRELSSEREELETLRTELAADADRLRKQTQELRRWADARNEEIERQAAFLTSREAELDRQDSHLQQQLQTWRQERFRMEQELRRLKSERRRAGQADYEPADVRG